MKKSENIKCPWCGEVFINSNSFCPCCNCKVNGTEKSRINNKQIVGKEKRSVVKSCNTAKKYQCFKGILGWKGFRFFWRKKWYLVIMTVLLIGVIGVVIFVLRHPFGALFILFVVLSVLGCIVNGGSGGISSASGGGSGNICDRDSIFER